MKNNARIVLISPLYWGLGHAMRIVPIAKNLHDNGCKIIIAAAIPLIEILKTECPYATFIEDTNKEIKYGNNYFSTVLKLILQLPKLLLQLINEQKLVNEWVKKYGVDFIISDNRYGLYHKEIPSVILTHQLNIRFIFGEIVINKISQFFLKKFNAIWIPDNKTEENRLAGNLSQSIKLNHHYIGLLSRFNKVTVKQAEKTPNILIILSGPEPQRMLFENKIMDEVKQHQLKATLVRGTRQVNHYLDTKIFSDCYNICNTSQLIELINACSFVLCRAGYSSIMDLVRLQKQAVLIPTPGQSEQEYLSEYVMKKKWFLSMSQNDFSLKDIDQLLVNYKPPQELNKQTDFYQLLQNMK